ncbi:MAG: hypothetical protein HZB46_10605 [Solirubrobacterales bacterium]|nr:hypothetical protein [Solirubrobacterales bacterium]
MHIDVDRIETGPGGPSSVLVKAHGRVGEGVEGQVVVRIEGRTYALVPVELPAELPAAEGEALSAAIVMPAQVAETLSGLRTAAPQRPEPEARRPSAAHLAELAERAGLE